MIPEIKKIIRECNYTDAQSIAEEVNRIGNPPEIITYLKARTNEVLPGAF